MISDVNGQTVPQKFCEAAMRIPVNYDLTADACVAISCRESWVFPHLSIVYKKNSFTVYTPRPVSNDDHRPVSVWSAKWEGVEKPLTPSATFDWDGVTNVFGKIALRHDASPTAINVKIWRDMRGARDTSDAAPKARHDFEPVVVPRSAFNSFNELAPQFISLGVELTQVTEQSGTQLSRLQSFISEQQDAVALAAQDVPNLATTGDANTPVIGLPQDCGMFRATLRARRADQDVAALKEIMTDTDQSLCDTIKAYTALLQSLDRAAVPGSWLWLVLQN